MQQVPFEELKAWQTISNDVRIPSSIDCICGFCNTLANLQTSFVSNDPSKTVVMKGRCTRCEEISKVFIINETRQQQDRDNGKCECWVYPKSEIRKYRFQSEEINPPRIAKSYKDAIDSFNEGRASLSIIACGRVVEGIAKINFPNAASTNQIGKLFKKLKRLSNQKNPRRESSRKVITASEFTYTDAYSFYRWWRGQVC